MSADSPPPSRPAWPEVLESPDHFLAGIDAEGRVLEFVHSSRERLSSASFVDGRSPLGDGPTLRVPLDDALAWFRGRPAGARTDRLLLHMSFCGSTLLARLLDVPGRSHAHKEPRALIQLADQQAFGGPAWHRDGPLLTGFVLDQLALPWPDAPRTLIKPSNWVNSMLPRLTATGAECRVLLLSLTPEQFLTAVFRGGGERVQYVHGLLMHLCTALPDLRPRIAEVERDFPDTVDLFARLVLIAHAAQTRLFEQARAALPGECTAGLTFDQLLEDPESAALRASEALQLGLTPEEIRTSVARRGRHHAKVTDRFTSAEEIGAVDHQVREHYREPFARALDWFGERF
jgi:hypothetical protein